MDGRRLARCRAGEAIKRALREKLYLRPAGTGPVAENLYAVGVGTVAFYVHTAGDSIVCFDTGYGKAEILRELKTLEIDPLDVTHVFLTHADVDHTGGLGLFKNAGVYLSRAEEPMFKGLKTPRRRLRSPRIRRQYTLLSDGDIVRASTSEIRAVATPGHTPGSMSYILNGTMLFVGDTCKLRDGKVFSGRQFTLDRQEQDQSIEKLAGLSGIRLVMTAHSGFTAQAEAAFAGWRTAAR